MSSKFTFTQVSLYWGSPVYSPSRFSRNNLTYTNMTDETTVATPATEEVTPAVETAEVEAEVATPAVEAEAVVPAEEAPAQA